MSTDIRLCSECQKVDFESHFYVPPSKDHDVSYRFLADDGTRHWWKTYKAVRIGSIGSVAQRSDSCDLCALILELACDVLAEECYSDSESESDENSAETTSCESSPVSSTSETLDLTMCPGETARSGVPVIHRRHSDGGDTIEGKPKTDQVDAANGGEDDAETMTLDINRRQFKLPLTRNGHPIMCALGPEVFGMLNHAWWKQEQVEELAICKLFVRFGDEQTYTIGGDLQVCVDAPDTGLPTQGTGREVAALVDLSRVKSWIEICRSQHGDACEKPHWLDSLELASGLRMIDVVGNKIVPAIPGCRYLALSYVWGKSTLLERRGVALKSNIKRLEDEGGLAVLELPRTIRDALVLTKELGERYLWVDALCIVQDDLEDSQRQIAAMDSVFSGAVLTIAAAAGDDADYGLPGLNAGFRRNPPRKIRLTEKLSLLRTVNHELKRSTWEDRGWTFQERVLSRRMRTSYPAIHAPGPGP